MVQRKERARWTSGAGLVQAKEVLLALVGGDPLHPLGLGTKDGRIDLRGFVMPSPVEVSSVSSDKTGMQLGVYAGLVELKGTRFVGVDFSMGSLSRVGLTGAEFEDCLFDGADCSGMRVIGSTFRDCSFEKANLRDASLGVTRDGRRTEYSDVRFTSAKMSRAHAIEAHFSRCDFSGATLDKADFMGSSFEDCVFAGEVNDAIFYGRAPSVALEHGHDGSLNRMAGVDMRRAKLRFVAFRHLDLKEAMLPNDEDHLVLRPYTAVLAATVDVLRGDSRPAAQRLVFMLENGELRWAIDGQDTGVLQLSTYRPDEREVLLEAMETAKASFA